MQDPKNFYISTQAIIKAEGQGLAMKKTFDDKEIFTLPGGRIDHGEMLLETLHRELKEETGADIDTEDAEYIGNYMSPRDFDNGNGLFILIFKIELPKKFDVVLSEEHTGFEWCPWEEYLELGFHYEGVKLKKFL
ncbi:MAG TPA: NUDIX hydrolase [Candidatus Dojkabacteria bacterium]|jgi:8-oxo-dGTP pyrophosphatase MutT (NUDIX family)